MKTLRAMMFVALAVMLVATLWTLGLPQWFYGLFGMGGYLSLALAAVIFYIRHCLLVDQRPIGLRPLCRLVKRAWVWWNQPKPQARYVVPR